MRSLGVIMLHIFINDASQVRFTEDQHLIETLGFYAPDESFNEGVHIWTCYGSLYASYPTRSQYRFELLCKQRVPIMYKILLILQKAVDRIGKVTGYLLHPSAVCLGNSRITYDSRGAYCPWTC
jgi:hypothetical protein